MNSQFCYDMVTLKMGTRFATAQFLSSKWFCCLRKRQNAIKTISLQLNGVKLANTYNYQLSDKVAHNGNLLPSAYTNIHIDYLYSGSNQNLVCLQQKFFHKLWSSCCRTVIQRQNDRSALQSECNQLSGVSYCRKTELDNCTVLAVSFCKPSALWEWLQSQLQCCLQADCLMLERGHPEVESSTCSNSNKNQCNYKAIFPSLKEDAVLFIPQCYWISHRRMYS